MLSRDDVLRMAREAGAEFHLGDAWWPAHIEDLERFAALVAAAEREACAKACEGEHHVEGQFVANEFAAAIRARAGGA